MPRLRHRLEYAGFRAALASIGTLSDAAAARVGERLGGLGYTLRIKRDVVERNLRIAFPDRDDAWRARVARASYAHLGRETVMMLRLSQMTREQVIEHTIFDEGCDAARELRGGQGLVVVSGHLGNWELGAAMVAVRGYPVDAIAKSAANPLFYEHILAARARLGVQIIDFMAARRQALVSLRSGRAVAFAADQFAGRAGIAVPFFGQPTLMYRGPALLALRTDSPVYLSVSVRRPDGRYEMTLEPVAVERTGELENDVARLTTAWAANLERAIRRYPEQYLWQHRRWRHAGLVPTEPGEAESKPVEEQPSPGKV